MSDEWKRYGIFGAHVTGLTMVMMGAVMVALGLFGAPPWLVGFLGYIAIIRGIYLI